ADARSTREETHDVTARSNNLTRDEARQRASLVHDLRYRVTLDLTGEEDFGSETILQFRCSQPGAETFLDLTAPTLNGAELNGERPPAKTFDGNRIRLARLVEANELRAAARSPSRRTETGPH